MKAFKTMFITELKLNIRDMNDLLFGVGFAVVITIGQRPEGLFHKAIVSAGKSRFVSGDNPQIEAVVAKFLLPDTLKK